jgi:hypothetical protein
MTSALRLAGFFAAHAVWCVYDGETLIPILAFTDETGERKMERLVVEEDLVKSVAYGRDRLQRNEMDANDAVLIYDGFVDVSDEKLDAIVIEIRSYFSPGSEATLAIPYTPKGDRRFAVHRPKVLRWEQCEDLDLQAGFEAFFEGVQGHDKGSHIWTDALDESK